MSEKTYLACCGPKRFAAQAAMACDSDETARFQALGSRIAWAQQVYPEEREKYIAQLRKQGLLVGEFPTHAEAFTAASAALDEPPP